MQIDDKIIPKKEQYGRVISENREGMTHWWACNGEWVPIDDDTACKNKPNCGKYFSRPVDVGEGYRLVGWDEAMGTAEYGYFKEEWIALYIPTSELRTVEWCITKNGAQHLAFRRRIQPETKPAPTNSEFYMVHVEGTRPPTFKHELESEAVTEAERLALKESKNASVLKCQEVKQVRFVPARVEVV